MASTSVFSELIASIADRGLGIIDLGRTRVQAATVEGLGELCDQLLSGRGDACPRDSTSPSAGPPSRIFRGRPFDAKVVARRTGAD